MIYYIIIILTFIYGYSLFLWNKRTNWKLNNQISKVIKGIHYTLIGIILIDLILISITGFHYRGIWTSRIFIIGFIITGLIIYPFASKEILKRFERIYFTILGFSPVGLGLFALIPFLGAIVTLSFGLQLVNPVSNVLYNDSNIRIQQCSRGVLGAPRLMIVEKRFLTEGVQHDMYGFFIEAYDSLSVNYEKDSVRITLSTDNYRVYGNDTILEEDLYFAIKKGKQHIANEQHKTVGI